jgi:hypothetical protein
MYFAKSERTFADEMTKTKRLHKNNGEIINKNMNALRTLLHENKGVFLPAISY